MKTTRTIAFYIGFSIILIIIAKSGFSLPQDVGAAGVDNSQYHNEGDAGLGPLQFLSQTASVDGDPSLLAVEPNLGANPNQYTLTMTSTQTRIRTLVVSEYPTRSGNTCTGTATATATMTASSDETFVSGHTYAATDASSWSMVNNNGGATNWKKVCTKYEYKDSVGSVLHTAMFVAWYSGVPGGSNCVSGTCGQNTACNDSW